jgi:hypothetical protein
MKRRARSALLVPALALAVVSLSALPAAATVIATASFEKGSTGCSYTNPTVLSDPGLYVQNAGSGSTSDYAGSYSGEFDVVTTPSLVTADVRATAYTAANTWSCVPAVGTVSATDLTFSSVGGAESTIHVRFSLGFTSVWSGSNALYRGVWTYAQLGTFVAHNGNGGPFEVISRPPDDAGSDTACYTSPWFTVPVGTPQYVAYTMYAGTQAGANASTFADAVSTMSAGCAGGDFIEIQETGFTVNSAELGLVAGAFLAPEPGTVGLVLSGLVGLSARRRARSL